MEIVCLDTNILIDHKRAKKDEKDKTKFFKLASHGYQFAVSSITAFELLRGDDSKEDIFWKDFFARVTRYDFDFDTAEIAGSIYRDFEKQWTVD